MPYITLYQRARLDPDINTLLSTIENRGELAYSIYRLVMKGKRYENFSAARAALKDVYDMLTEEYIEYEKQKRTDNGGIL